MPTTKTPIKAAPPPTDGELIAALGVRLAELSATQDRLVQIVRKLVQNAVVHGGQQDYLRDDDEWLRGAVYQLERAKRERAQ